MIDGLAARIPAQAMGNLARTKGVAAITPDGQVHFNIAGDGYDSEQNFGSLYNTAKAIDATALWNQGIPGQGIDVACANAAPAPISVQAFAHATGVGSIQLARGSALIKDKFRVELLGDVDIFGHAYSVALSGNSWSGGVWNGNSWSGNSWSGNSWSGNSRSGNFLVRSHLLDSFLPRSDALAKASD